MAAKRSPILGYNHNVRYRGRVFHVQTEDSGVGNPHVFTHLFHGGVIINTRKLDYDPGSEEAVVKSLMQAQHKAMLKDLKAGKFEDKIVAYLGPHPESGADETPVPAPQREHPRPATFESALELTAEPESEEERIARTTGAIPAAVPEDRTEPSRIHQAAPLLDDEPEDNAGVVHAPAPISVPVPPGAGTYVMSGGGRKEAPLLRSREMPAVPEPPELPPPVDADPVRAQLGDTESARGKRVSRPPPIPSDAGRGRPSRPPSRPPNQRISGRMPAARPPQQQRPAAAPANSGVVVSRPAVIVGGPPRVVDGSARTRSASRGTMPRIATPGNATPAPVAASPSGSTQRPRMAREERAAENLFGQDLISEKSLDEVILAYLSEDPADD